ncbi:hypothetical protein FEDK69T_30040 [Flavobacterium enshiense DK69]|nr:hypothetical protein FEDK69T_30040 [Flavobacterium enshiense DK69]
MQAGFLGFIGGGQCLHFLLRSEAFSFNLFGIFVSISNKNPRLTQSRRDVVGNLAKLKLEKEYSKK